MTAPASPPPRWKFAIDVGGTFTDCLARSPDGTQVAVKVLSSGVAKGEAQTWESPHAFRDSSRIGEPDQLWKGSQLRWISQAGDLLGESRIVAFESTTGTMHISTPLNLPKDTPGFRYELVTDQPSPLLAIRRVLGIPVDQPLPPVDVRLGTTRGTNALLTRSGPKTAWLTTLGFKDALRIGNQDRPDLFSLDIQKPTPLASIETEVEERIDANGVVITPLNMDDVHKQLNRLRNEGAECLAICLLNAYVNPTHEQLILKAAQSYGFTSISASHQVAPLIKLISRGNTTVLDCYLNPVLQGYLTQIQSLLHPASQLVLMTSAGDLVSADQFSGKDSLLSGPAGGVIGCQQEANRHADRRGIGFDMGGTSTDVSRVEGELALEQETQKAGIPVYAPTLSIETVAAGGGSVCWYDAGRTLVGPQSAGADPGPACYGRGGPLTVTDLNVWLGHLVAERFPFALDRAAIEKRLTTWRDTIRQESGRLFTLDELADGWLRVANGKMAEAIRTVSVAQGYDPRDFALIAFGGAAGQHACAIADELGMSRVLVPAYASIFSAAGIDAAVQAKRITQGVYRPVTSSTLAEFQNEAESLAKQATRALNPKTSDERPSSVELSVDLRFIGTDSAIRVPFGPNAISEFHRRHEQRFGFRDDRPLEVVSLEAVARLGQLDDSRHTPTAKQRKREFPRTKNILDGTQTLKAAIVERQSLHPGDWLNGPALIVDDHSTTYLPETWQALLLDSDSLELCRLTSAQNTTPHPATNDEANRRLDLEPDEPHAPLDPIKLEILANQFQGIAQQMGAMLRNTATSVNVKERLDYSCALFDKTGNLVVNAPHIPVHLGAMSETVRCLIQAVETFSPGDVFLTNDPYEGGSHLPDLTVVTPVFVSNLSTPSFFVASRAHHAEIGGRTPGSMPPDSKRLGEEGVILRHYPLVRNGQHRLEQLRSGLQGKPHSEDAERLVVEYPSRDPQANLADIQAQMAANQRGVQALKDLCDRYGSDHVQQAMLQWQSLAREGVVDLLNRLGEGSRSFSSTLDDGSQIQVTATIANQRLLLDFAGTAEMHPGNLNANRGIVIAAVLYSLRCLLTHRDQLNHSLWIQTKLDKTQPPSVSVPVEKSSTPLAIPLNHGLLDAVDLRLPTGMLNPPAIGSPAQRAAVVGGNVETSQRVVDVLLGVFGVAAASQGTMNNLLFGDDSFGYYETIAGGAGATCFCDGTSAVHTHMTNTRITDPEVLESRFPVRLKQFAIRTNSGGAGMHHGGDGVVRELEFLRPLQVTLLTNRRLTPPFGLADGEPGQPGTNRLHRHDTSPDNWETLTPATQFQAERGDILRIETPGGGGMGNPNPR